MYAMVGGPKSQNGVLKSITPCKVRTEFLFGSVFHKPKQVPVFPEEYKLLAHTQTSSTENIFFCIFNTSKVQLSGSLAAVVFYIDIFFPNSIKNLMIIWMAIFVFLQYWLVTLYSVTSMRVLGYLRSEYSQRPRSLIRDLYKYSVVKNKHWKRCIYCSECRIMLDFKCINSKKAESKQISKMKCRWSSPFSK